MEIEMVDEITHLAQLVDDYVLACAEASAADSRKELAKQALLATGKTHMRGTLNKVSVTTVAGRASINVKAMVSDGLLTAAQVAAYTTTGKESQRVTVSALT